MKKISLFLFVILISMLNSKIADAQYDSFSNSPVAVFPPSGVFLHRKAKPEPQKEKKDAMKEKKEIKKEKKDEKKAEKKPEPAKN